MLTGLEIGCRLLLAGVLGAVVGYQRGLRHHSAGLRTHIMVTLAATLFAIVSSQFIYHAPNSLLRGTSPNSFDPSRIASYVVAGIGFLGAGTIRQGKGRAHGLTTAASLWLMTAVGLAIGIGMYATSVLVVATGVFVLDSLRHVEHYLIQRAVRRRVRIVFDALVDRDATIARLAEMPWEASGWSYASDRESGTFSLRFKLKHTEKQLSEVLAMLEALPGVRRIELKENEIHD